MSAAWVFPTEPGSISLLILNRHAFEVTATDEVGCDTGRRRYRVECVTCKTVLHANTTGPECRIRSHAAQSIGGAP